MAGPLHARMNLRRIRGTTFSRASDAEALIRTESPSVRSEPEDQDS